MPVSDYVLTITDNGRTRLFGLVSSSDLGRLDVPRIRKLSG